VVSGNLYEQFIADEPADRAFGPFYWMLIASTAA